MFTGRPERLTSFDYMGLYAYFLTYCTDRRHRAFVHADRVALVRTQILRASTEEGFALVAYCYMPDHLHLLVAGTREDSNCRAFITRSKQLSGFYYQKAFAQRLWQRYVYERVLRADENLLCVARYILENPVRARLCTGVHDYPFAGSDRYSVGEILDALRWSPARRSG